MIRTSLILCILLVVLRVNAQSVDRNDVVISVSPGAALYYLESLDSIGPFSGGSSRWSTRTPVSFEYVFNRGLGITADVVYSQLFLGTPHPSNANTLDFGFGLRFHSPSDKRRIDWFGELGFHYSKLHYFYHGDLTHHTTTANGFALFYDLGANVPLSANECFGMGISLNGSGNKYSSAHDETSYGTTHDFRLNALSFAAGINLYYKL